MSDPKEKEVQAILQAIDYGHPPPRETQRRLLNIIQAEADCPRARGCPPAAHYGSASEKRKKASKAEENYCRSGLQCRGDCCRLCRIASVAVV